MSGVVQDVPFETGDIPEDDFEPVGRGTIVERVLPSLDNDLEHREIIRVKRPKKLDFLKGALGPDLQDNPDWHVSRELFTQGAEEIKTVENRIIDEVDQLWDRVGASKGPVRNYRAPVPGWTPQVEEDEHVRFLLNKGLSTQTHRWATISGLRPDDLFLVQIVLGSIRLIDEAPDDEQTVWAEDWVKKACDTRYRLGGYMEDRVEYLHWLLDGFDGGVH